MQHGGDPGDAETHTFHPDLPWLDLSTGINPHPWPVPEALREAGWTRLPARTDGERLIGAARGAYRVSPGLAVAAAPGTQALIQWLPRIAPEGGVAVLGPTYTEHAAAWRLAGRAVAEIGRLAAWPDEARHLVVVNPNNPDGRVLSGTELVAAARTCATRGGWLVVDESFADVDPAVSLAGHAEDLPVVVLRSFGKFYGLAGLRLGFAIASPGIVHELQRALGPWAVSGPALAIGAAALADRGWADDMRVRLGEEAARLDGVLAAAGLDPAGGTSLYRLVRHPRAAAIHAALAAERIWVRRFEWAEDLLRFGLPPDSDGLERLRLGLAKAVRGQLHGTITGWPRCSAR